MSIESPKDLRTPLSTEEQEPFKTEKAKCQPLGDDLTIEDYFPFRKHIAKGAFGSVDKRKVGKLGADLLRLSQPEGPLPNYVVVKKIFPAHESIRPEALKEMLTEISLLRKLSHSTLDVIPKYYGCLVGTNAYLVMEWIQGSDLISLIEKGNPLIEAEKYEEYEEYMDKLFSIAYRLVTPALIQLHSHGIVHGDVRPENIRLGANGKMYLIDL